MGWYPRRAAHRASSGYGITPDLVEHRHRGNGAKFNEGTSVSQTAPGPPDRAEDQTGSAIVRGARSRKQPVTSTACKLVDTISI